MNMDAGSTRMVCGDDVQPALEFCSAHILRLQRSLLIGRYSAPCVSFDGVRAKDGTWLPPIYTVIGLSLVVWLFNVGFIALVIARLRRLPSLVIGRIHSSCTLAKPTSSVLPLYEVTASRRLGLILISKALTQPKCLSSSVDHREADARDSPFCHRGFTSQMFRLKSRRGLPVRIACPGNWRLRWRGPVTPVVLLSECKCDLAEKRPI